jgi:hypothetical protein
MNGQDQTESQRRRILLACDHMVGFPVWDEEGAVERSSLPLSDELVTELHEWQLHWEQWFDWERGWRGEEHVHEETGRRLLKAVRRELKSDFDVTLRL